MKTLPFAKPDLEIDLIYEDINNINATMRTLWQADKDDVFTVKNAEAGTISYRVRPPEIPAAISSVYTKLMTQLKHILDQSVNASYIITHGKESSKLHFPNGSNKVSFDAAMNGNHLRLLSDPVRDIIKKSQPFKGGNDELYELCKLARIKHRPVYLNIKPRVSGNGVTNGRLYQIALGSKYIDSEGCYEVAVEPISTNNTIDIIVGCEIILLEKGPFFQKNAIECVLNLLDLVRGIHTEIKRASI